MKKKYGIVGILFFLLFLMTACGEKEKTATYILKQDDENVTVQHVYKEDTLLKQTITTVIQYKTIGVKSKAKAEKLLEPSKPLYSNKKGISFSIDFQEKEAVEKIEIDLKKISEEDAKMLPFLFLPEGKLGKISEKANKEKLIQLGFKEKK